MGLRIRTTSTGGKKYVQVIEETWNHGPAYSSTRIVQSMGRETTYSKVKAMMILAQVRSLDEWITWCIEQGMPFKEVRDTSLTQFGLWLGQKEIDLRLADYPRQELA